MFLFVTKPFSTALVIMTITIDGQSPILPQLVGDFIARKFPLRTHNKGGHPITSPSKTHNIDTINLNIPQACTVTTLLAIKA